MMVFAAVAAALLLLAVGIWMLAMQINPQLSAQEQHALALEQVNTYRLRLRELAHEQSNQLLDEAEYQHSLLEQKRQLLHDLTTQNAKSTKGELPLVLPGVLFLLLFVGGFYYANGESSKLEEWADTVQLLPELGKRAVLNQGDSLNAKELQQFALGLRTQLHESGDDSVAWLLLGRVTMALNDHESALLAFDKAYRLEPNKSATLLSYSEALLMQPERNGMIKAASMLAEVLKQQPQNVDALLMTGYVAEQFGDLAQAKISWQTLLTILPESDQRRAFIEAKLTSADAAPSNALASNKGSGEEKAGVAEASLQVNVTLADGLKDKVPEGAVLFVYAKSPTGMPMPAAVVKLTQFSFPLTVHLSDAQAMMQNHKLSSLASVVVYARVSKDQDIAVTSGELQGQTAEFLLADKSAVAVVINNIL